MLTYSLESDGDTYDDLRLETAPLSTTGSGEEHTSARSVGVVVGGGPADDASASAVGARLRTFESRGEDGVGAYGERRAVRREEFVRHIRLPRIGPRATDLLRQHRTNGGLRVGRHGKRWPLL